MEEDGTKPYYESIDMEDAYHPQTLLAYELNGKTLPIANGAPIRLRVERQLGYKQAKYIMRIELVESFDHIAGGKGGYWEDEGYTWYAGILLPKLIFCVIKKPALLAFLLIIYLAFTCQIINYLRVY